MAQTPTSPTERLVPLADVKELLEKAEAARGELSYEQKLALEHARRFAKLSAEKATTLVQELMQNPKIEYGMAVRVADLAPTNIDDVRALFSKSRANLDEAEIQKILESVSKYTRA